MMLISQFVSCAPNEDDPHLDTVTSDDTSDKAEEKNPFEIVYPSVSASTLKFELTDSDLEEFKSKFNAIKELYEKNESGSEELFKTAVYELLSLEAKMITQRDIAHVQYYYDMSDSAAWDNYVYAYDMQDEAHDLFWDFYNDVKNSGTLLANVLSEVMDKEFPVRVSAPASSADHYAKQMRDYEGEYNSLRNSNASDEQIFGVYKKYLKAADGYARAYYCDNYYEYASQKKFHRTDTKEERELLREYTRTYLVPLYRELRANSKSFDATLSNKEYNLSNKYLEAAYDSFEENYLTSYFSSLQKSSGDAMNAAFEKDMVLIGDKANSYKSALVTSVGNVRMCYFHEDETSLDVMSHEIGHYYAHCVNDCTLFAFDLSETHSTANNMLLYSYLSSKLDNKAFKSAELYSVYNWMYQVILSVIKDEFDEIIYTADASTLTLDGFERIMNELIDKYDARNLANNTEYQLSTYWRRLGITYPMQNYCYATANLASLQIYLKSKENYNEATEIYKKIVEEPMNNGEYIATIVNAGLTTPYDAQTYLTLNALKNINK